MCTCGLVAGLQSCHITRPISDDNSLQGANVLQAISNFATDMANKMDTAVEQALGDWVPLPSHRSPSSASQQNAEHRVRRSARSPAWKSFDEWDDGEPVSPPQQELMPLKHISTQDRREAATAEAGLIRAHRGLQGCFHVQNIT